MNFYKVLKLEEMMQPANTPGLQGGVFSGQSAVGKKLETQPKIL